MKKKFRFTIYVILLLLISCGKTEEINIKTSNNDANAIKIIKLNETTVVENELNNITFINGKNVKLIYKDDEQIKLLIDGKEYGQDNFEQGGRFEINTIFPNAMDQVQIALITWNYFGSCCIGKEYQIVYAHKDKLYVKFIDNFKEVNFNIDKGSLQNIKIQTLENGKIEITSLIPGSD